MQSEGGKTSLSISEKSWYDDLTDQEAKSKSFESWLAMMDMKDRIDCDCDDVVSEEFNEECHRMEVILI